MPGEPEHVSLEDVLQEREPLAMSLQRVAYPTESSDLFPVATTSQPNLFDSAISSVPRMRAWRFSVRSASRSSKTLESASS